jgi:hypothetical protein
VPAAHQAKPFFIAPPDKHLSYLIPLDTNGYAYFSCALLVASLRVTCRPVFLSEAVDFFIGTGYRANQIGVSTYSMRTFQ